MRTYLNNSSLLALFLALFFTGHVWAKTIDCTLTGNVNGVPSKILINYALKRGTNRFDDKGITVQMNRQYTQSLMKMLGAPITWQVKGSGFMADYLLDGFKYIEGPLKAGTYEVGDWQFIATAPDGQTWNLIRVLDQETVAQYACKQG